MVGVCREILQEPYSNFGLRNFIHRKVAQAKNLPKVRILEIFVYIYLSRPSIRKVYSIRFLRLQKFIPGLRMKYLLKAPAIYMKITMKYPGAKNGNIHWKCQAFIWKAQWNILGLRMKYLLKAPGIYMKSAMKYPGAKNEISIESTSYLYEKCNEISWG